MILNAAQLGTYSQSKQMLLRTGYFRDDFYLHFAASLVSGFISTVVSMPMDLTKTRLQTMQNNEYSVRACHPITPAYQCRLLTLALSPYSLTH
jgi:solute carrier family 25 oxoglutarate transporter 11